MASQAYTHNTLKIICLIEPDQNKNEPKIIYFKNLDKLLSTIVRKFPFLEAMNRQDWSICINSHDQIIDKANPFQFSYVLSTLPPPAVVYVVGTPSPKRYTHGRRHIAVVVHLNNHRFEYNLRGNRNSLNDEMYARLLSSINREFNLYSSEFSLYGDGGVNIDDIEDIKDSIANESVDIFVKVHNTRHNNTVSNVMPPPPDPRHPTVSAADRRNIHIKENNGVNIMDATNTNIFMRRRKRSGNRLGKKERERERMRERMIANSRSQIPQFTDDTDPNLQYCEYADTYSDEGQDTEMLDYNLPVLRKAKKQLKPKQQRPCLYQSRPRRNATVLNPHGQQGVNGGHRYESYDVGDGQGASVYNGQQGVNGVHRYESCNVGGGQGASAYNGQQGVNGVHRYESCNVGGGQGASAYNGQQGVNGVHRYESCNVGGGQGASAYNGQQGVNGVHRYESCNVGGGQGASAYNGQQGVNGVHRYESCNVGGGQGASAYNGQQGV
eukprot:539872_1